MCSFEALCIFVHFAYTICNSNFLLRPGSQTGCRQVRQVIWPGSTGWGQGQGRNLHGYRSPCITHWFCTTWLTSTHLQKKCMHWHLFFSETEHESLPWKIPGDLLGFCGAVLNRHSLFNCITALSLYLSAANWQMLQAVVQTSAQSSMQRKRKIVKNRTRYEGQRQWDMEKRCKEEEKIS